jgi:hypothetical protein
MNRKNIQTQISCCCLLYMYTCTSTIFKYYPRTPNGGEMSNVSDGFTIVPRPNLPWLQGGKPGSDAASYVYPGLRLHVCRHHTTSPLSSHTLGLNYYRRDRIPSLHLHLPAHALIHLPASRLSTPTLRLLDARRALGLGRRVVDQ